MAVAVALIAGCAEMSGPGPAPGPAPAPVRAEGPGSLGALDAVYDRGKWTWVKNPDGRALLSHTAIQKCFLDPKPAQDYNEPGFVVKRDRRTIGKTSYDVLNVYENRDFWIAVYQRPGSREPLLGVYSEGACRAEAERLLEAYEQRGERP